MVVIELIRESPLHCSVGDYAGIPGIVDLAISV